MHHINTNQILKMILFRAPISRIEISHRTGISKMVISNIVNKFLEEGVVYETGTHGTGVGRHPIQLDIVENSRFAVGVEIRDDKVCGGVYELKGHKVVSRECPLCIDADNQDLTEAVFDVVEKLLKETEEVMGIGITSEAAYINGKVGKINSSVSLKNIGDLPIVELLEEKFELPAFTESSSNVAAMAEKYFGVGKKMSDFVYFDVTEYGAGSGIVINHELYHGRNGVPGEIGHITIDTNGEQCRCGNFGCLEHYIDLKKTVHKVKDKIAAGTLTAFGEVTFSAICKKAMEGEPYCAGLIDEFTENLASGMVTAINFFDPQYIILGERIGDSYLIEKLSEKTKSRMLGREFAGAPFVRTSFQNDIIPMGAAALAFAKTLI